MKQLFDRALAMFLAFTATFAQAALEEGAPAVPEPTVNVFWVGAFLVLFVVVCVWIGVAIWRAERKGRTEGSTDVKA